MKAKTITTGSQATRGALLDAAQELFAAQGIDATSLRAIQRLAQVAPGTLQYHFGSREDLLAALLARAHAGIAEKVADAAAQLLNDRERMPDARAIVEIWLRPYMDLIRSDPARGPDYLKIIAQLARTDDKRITPLVGEQSTVIPALIRRAYPDATPAAAKAGVVIAVRSLLLLLAGRSIDAAGKTSRREAEEIEAIATFVAAGLDALLRMKPARAPARRKKS